MDQAPSQLRRISIVMGLHNTEAQHILAGILKQLITTKRLQGVAEGLSSLQELPVEYYEYVVIGAGISGVQAAEVLASAGKSVIILEANDYAGGRIRTQGIVTLPQAQGVKWIEDNRFRLKTAHIEHGATWLSAEHTFALRWMKQLELTTYKQYMHGLTVHGRREGSYLEMEDLGELYVAHRRQIEEMLSHTASLVAEFELLTGQLNREPHSIQKQRIYAQFIEKLDKVDMRTYIKQFFVDKALLELIVDTIETEECIPCHKLSLFHTISSGAYSIENLKVYLGLANEVTDELKIREGLGALVNGIIKRAEKHTKQTGIVRLCEPVVEIINDKQPVQVITGKCRYKCSKVVWSVPLATSAHIQVSRLSESKRIFFSGQEPAYAVKLFFVFKKAFWRVKFCGNAYFSQEFPFTELIEVSPADLSCGILAFFFLADKIKQWEDRFGEDYTTHQIIENKKKYALKVIADMFLEGNIDSPELQDVVMAERSYRHNKYIRSCYQSISKLGTTAQIESKFKDSSSCKTRDQHNIVFIGSQLGDDFGTYAEGAIRYARKKTYELLATQDPWLAS